MNVEDAVPISTRRRALLLVGVAVVVVALFALSSAALLMDDSDENPSSARGEFRAGERLPEIVLQSASGSVSLPDGLSGRPALMYFGYTNCPDFCPLTLSTFVEIKRQLGAQGDAVTYAFVSVDGRRDTAEIARDYVHRFDSGFIGLTGPEDDVRELGQPLGLWFERASSDSELRYTVDHTTSIYLIDADGAAVREYPFDAPALEIVADLRAELDLPGE